MIYGSTKVGGTTRWRSVNGFRIPVLYPRVHLCTQGSKELLEISVLIARRRVRAKRHVSRV